MIIEKTIRIFNMDKVVFTSDSGKKIRNKKTGEEFIIAFKGTDTVDKYEEVTE